MKNLKFYLDTRGLGDDTPAPVKIRYSKGGQAGFLPTDIRVSKNQWDSDQQLIAFHPKARTLNLYLAQKMAEVEAVFMEHHAELRPLTASEAVRKVRYYLDPESQKLLFMEYAEKFAETKNKKRTQELYTTTLSRIRAYTTKHSTLRFEDITQEWLRGFDKFLAKTSPSRNARNIHFRNIRAIFNDAIDEELITYYPFRKFKIRPEATVKRSLTVEQMARLFTHTHEDYAVRYLDMFKLSFYLIGINIIDLVGLKEITAGRIVYHREKTGRLYSIKVEPEAMEIIEKYRGETSLIGFLGEYKNYHSFVALINKALHVIGAELDGDSPDKVFSGLTSYWARHTWATLAAELEIPKETIAKALGHGGNEVTDVYIRFDDKKIDIANRRVIDYLNEHIKRLQTLQNTANKE